MGWNFFKVSFTFLLILLLAPIACSPKIVDFVNSGSNFKNYKTYTVVNYKTKYSDISDDGHAILTLIESNIEKEMERRDYEYTNDSPDLLLRYELISNQQTQYTQNNYSPFYPSFNNYVSARTVLESALLIEMTDIKTKKLVWQASMDMDKYAKKSSKEEIVSEVISKLFDTYLYRAKSSMTDQSLISDK